MVKKKNSLQETNADNRLREQAAIGFAQLEAGEATVVKSRTAFVALVRGEPWPNLEQRLQFVSERDALPTQPAAQTIYDDRG